MGRGPIATGLERPRMEKDLTEIDPRESASTALVLVVDDDNAVATAHSEILNELGFGSLVVTDPREVMTSIQSNPAVAVVLLDMRMPHLSGLELLPRIKASRPDLGVIVATVINDVQYAVEATKAGAYNYLLKPLESIRLGEVIESCLSNVPVSVVDDSRFNSFITQDTQFVGVFNRVKSFAEGEVPVLVQGETGTGKELIARLVHSLSPRVNQPFVAINVAAISAELFESELFGHKKGSFTGAYNDKAGYFETASEGTLFLDEIGELTSAQQKKLLRVLQGNTYFRVGDTQERQTNVRLVMATNRDLQVEVEEGRFRSDLYYRIASHLVKIPPLRERPGDIPVLSRYFLKKHSAQFGRTIEQLAAETLHVLCSYPFPGNVRELEGCISAAVLLEQSPVLMPFSLPHHISQTAQSSYQYSNDAKYTALMQALAACNGNQTLAAKKLGVARETLNRWLKKYQASNVDE